MHSNIAKRGSSMGKGTSWADEEVKMLINVWAEANIQQQLDEAVRNKAIFERITSCLRDAGFDKDWVQCRAKLKNLKATYKKVKDNNDRSGRARRACKYFDDIDAILGCRPATQPPGVIESATKSRATTNSPDGSSDSERSDVESYSGDVEQQLEVGRNSEIEQTENGEKEQVENEGQSQSNPGHSDEENERIVKSPPAKKQKTKGKKKMTTAEKITAGMMKAFVEYQERSEEKFLRFEKMRAKEERDYEERMLRLILASQQGSTTPQYPPPPPHAYYGGPSYSHDMQGDSFSSDY